ncbi:MAG TPA: ATP-binding cassette domain-containing protein [Candidatus Marinimicrobia bacterium]|nr:ATP-binding cassette domain-containing protein [Flavobacteriales bacterium]HIO56943.1 ATP-binding cassette domain-containing protein [Candidatus Neomarinimicrobiota bacterium]
MPEVLLSTENITKQYANHLALDAVSISVQEQRIFGLLGPNGAGKTSLIRIINQITAPDSGTILFEGKPLQPNNVEKIGYLPEERGLYKKMKVGEQSLYLAQLKGLSRPDALNRLKYWFEKFEIQSWWNKRVEELSKGMQQKIQFITTVLHEPKLLIFDEPFTGFDPINTELIKSEILELKEKGTTIIFSTHNMESVEELCDDIALINASKLILEGSMQDIKKSFRTNTYELTFKGSVDAFSRHLNGNELIDKVESNGSTRATVKLGGSDGSLNKLLEGLLPVVEIEACNEVIPQMREIFIRAVGGSSI